MATYSEKNVINFLVSLSFDSQTSFIYTRRGLVSQQFGCTTLTAAKWIDRAEETGLIKATSAGFVRADETVEAGKRERLAAVQNGVDSGKVVRLASARSERLRQSYADQSNVAS